MTRKSAKEIDKEKVKHNEHADAAIIDRIERYTDTNCPEPKGILIAIGGAEDKGKTIEEGDPHTRLEDYMELEIIKTFCRLTRKTDPKIEVIITASEEPEEVKKDYRAVFKKVGCTNIDFIFDAERESAISSVHLKRVEKADGIFFTGGSQLKLTAIYGGTEFMALLKHRYVHESVVIAGTSAGAMAMSTPMIYHSAGSGDILKGEVQITTGLEFIKDVAIDTHFIQRGRFVRMAHVLASNPNCIGVGIEEDTAVIIRSGRDLEVIGNGAVAVMDAHSSTRSNIANVQQNEAVSIQNLTLHLLVKGDKYSIPLYNLQHK